jgi:hypothetical protein
LTLETSEKKSCHLIHWNGQARKIHLNQKKERFITGSKIQIPVCALKELSGFRDNKDKG